MTARHSILVSLVLAGLTAFSLSTVAHAAGPSSEMEIDIQPQSLTAALNDWARQTGLMVLAPDDAGSAVKVPGVRGRFTPADALERLLAGSPYRYQFVNERTVSVYDPAANPDTAQEPAQRPMDSAPLRLAQGDTGSAVDSTVEARSDNQATTLEEVVVTGTHIRGSKRTSAVVTITQQEMRLSGFANLGDVVRSLPHSFGGGQNPAVSGASGAFAGGIDNQNITGASSINLRGLGPDATLTLLNGRRLPYDGFSQATDVSVIPVAAIERVELLLDGASAIYGSDAVGGVANIILKRDYDGAEISARYGAATQGGDEQTQYTGVAGTTWASGGFLVTGDVTRNTGIEARQRDYLDYLPRPNTIFPAVRQKGALLSAHQRLGSRAELTLDSFYTDRHMRSAFNQVDFIGVQPVDSAVYGVASGLSFELSREWSLRAQGIVGHDRSDATSRYFDVSSGALLLETRECNCNKTDAVEATAEGPLFALPAGEARVAIGMGHRSNAFESKDRIAGVTVRAGSRYSDFGFVEINLPLVASEQGIRGVTGLTLNAAARHENYSDFGNITTPKFGLVWSLTPDFDVKASWGKSFKTPTLTQQFSPRTLALFPTDGVPGAPLGSTLLLTGGGNPDLGPERATTFSAGLEANPRLIPDLHLELSYFHVDYTDRVVQPLPDSFIVALTDPAYAEFVTHAPSVAEQNAAFAAADHFDDFVGAYDPEAVLALLQNGFFNAARRKVSGVDLSAGYGIEAFGGRLSGNASTTWLSSRQKLTSLSSEQPTAGVTFFPARFRGRGGLTWSRSGLTLASYLNYVDGVKDRSVIPNAFGASMTTTDLVLDYQGESAVIGGVGFNLAVMNVFDREPPRLSPVTPYYVNYDSTNYSAIGRTISLTLTKRF